MYYTLGDKTLHFYRYQCRFYVAHWDGGHVMTEKFKPFVASITEKTGIDAKNVEAAARDYFKNVLNPIAIGSAIAMISVGKRQKFR